jgi:hypothetical protein
VAKQKDIIENKVREKLDTVFEELASEYGLSAGDIAPENQMLFEHHTIEIIDIVNNWFENNK